MTVKSKCMIRFLIMIAVCFSNAQFFDVPSLMAQNQSQHGAWSKNTECGVPFWSALNLVVNKFPPSYRLVFIFIEQQDFTRENLRRVFLYLSAKYLQPECLMIVARSDEASLRRWIEYELAFNSIREDGSFERRKDPPIEPPRDLLSERGFYRANYSRLEVSEGFSFSLNPDAERTLTETIRQTPRFKTTGDDNADLVMAVTFDQEDEVKRLLRNGAHVNGANRYGNRPLITAILAGRSRIVRILLEKGADINQISVGGWTALMCALSNQNILIAEELLNRGADVNARADNGDTALIIAAEKGMARIVEHLRRNGADINVRDRFGRTPLTIAEENGSKAIVNALK